jgi:hypothetical protein
VLDVFTFIVLGILLSAGLYVGFRLGALPGQLARQRGHPQADAINVAGWVGLLTLGLLWPIALIWAFTRPHATSAGEPELRQEVQSLSERVQALEHQGGGHQRQEGTGR